MAENNGGSFIGGVVLILIFIGLARSCDSSSEYSSRGYSSTPTEDSDGELKETVGQFETARQKLVEVAFDESRTAQYVEAIDAELEEMDYDFEGILWRNTKSRTRFRDVLLEACRSRGIAPPESLSELGAPFDEKETSVDWGSSSDSSKFPDGVRQWMTKHGSAVDSLRQEVSRLSAKESVASKILALASLRETLQGKLREAQTQLRKFESEIEAIEQNARNERARKHITTLKVAMDVPTMRNAVETLRRKHSYAEDLRSFIDALESATTELQFRETQSRDEFAMMKVKGIVESQRLIEKIDLTLTKYRSSSFERRLDVDIDKTPQEVWQEMQAKEATATTT